MEAVLAMAPPMVLPERLVVAFLGFALAYTLARLVVGTTPKTSRVLISLGVVLLLVMGSSLLADDRSLLAFFVGALGGTIAVPRALSPLALSLRNSWRLPVSCLVFGPMLGIVLFVVTQFTEITSPLDRLYYFVVYTAAGSFAGLLSAGVVSIIVSRGERPGA